MAVLVLLLYCYVLWERGVSNVYPILSIFHYLGWRVGEQLPVPFMGAEETPSTMQSREAVKLKVRALATEQKRNVLQPDEDDAF